ncbi:MAG: FecR domain-containing protein [Gammaproteobacteria bacterium]
MDRSAPHQSQICAEAADWFARLQDAGSSSALREEFSQWLLRSPMHVEEFLAVTRAWGDLAHAPADVYSTESLIAAARAERGRSNVVSFGDALRGEPAKEPVAVPARRFSLALAATLVVLMIGVIAYVGVQRWAGLQHIRTALGEQRTIALADGSFIHLNTGSDLTVALGPHERRIRLLRGEARFDVAKDRNRPFFVETRQATVRAVGTVFNVRAAGASTAVTVVEGRVEVTRRGDPTPTVESAGAATPVTRATAQLGPGERAAVTSSGQILPNTGPPVERVLAWSEQRLVFRDEALADVIAEFNRYQEHPTRIADPALAAVTISGTFATNDAASLLQYLERYHHVHVEEGSDGERVLTLSRAGRDSPP